MSGKLERYVEELLRRKAKAYGAVCLKLDPAVAGKGIPDRLVVWRGNIYFIELKRPKGGRLSKTQQAWHDQLRANGATVLVINTIEQIEELFHYG